MGSTGWRKIGARLLIFSFFSAFRDALRSFNGIPPDWALGTWADLGVSFNGFSLDFEGLSGSSGFANATAFLGASATGVGGGLEGIASKWGLAGNLSFVEGLVWGANGLLVWDLTTLETLTGALGKGSWGAVSMTGVLGMWILTVGGASSTGRMRRSASFRMHHLTSWSMSGFLLKRVNLLVPKCDRDNNAQSNWH